MLDGRVSVEDHRDLVHHASAFRRGVDPQLVGRLQHPLNLSPLRLQVLLDRERAAIDVSLDAREGVFVVVNFYRTRRL